MSEARVAKCNVCSDPGDVFKVPLDEIGVELMKAHFAEKHPEVTLNV